MCMQTKDRGSTSFAVTAAGHVRKQTIEFLYSGGHISEDGKLSVDEMRHPFRAWSCFRPYGIYP